MSSAKDILERLCGDCLVAIVRLRPIESGKGHGSKTVAEYIVRLHQWSAILRKREIPITFCVSPELFHKVGTM